MILGHLLLSCHAAQNTRAIVRIYTDITGLLLTYPVVFLALLAEVVDRTTFELTSSADFELGSLDGHG